MILDDDKCGTNPVLTLDKIFELVRVSAAVAKISQLTAPPWKP